MFSYRTKNHLRDSTSHRRSTPQTAGRTIEALDDASSKPESPKHRFRIVVLDTVTALLGPQLSGISSQGNIIATGLPPLPQLRVRTACLPYQTQMPSIN